MLWKGWFYIVIKIKIRHDVPVIRCGWNMKWLWSWCLYILYISVMSLSCFHSDLFLKFAMWLHRNKKTRRSSQGGGLGLALLWSKKQIRTQFFEVFASWGRNGRVYSGRIMYIHTYIHTLAYIHKYTNTHTCICVQRKRRLC
jgi:hypothetical protein